MSTRWEYKVVRFSWDPYRKATNAIGIQKPSVLTDEIERTLNEHGVQGWELVSMGGSLENQIFKDSCPVLTFYFKRPVES